MELKGSKTEENLHTAFAGESQAHTKYLYYASKAAKDGYVQIGKLFEDTAKNEKEHAKIWFKELEGIGSTPRISSSRERTSRSGAARFRRAGSRFLSLRRCSAWTARPMSSICSARTR